MRIEYEETLDDIVDSQCRAADRSMSIKRARWQSAFWTALFSGIILFMYLTIRGATLAERFFFTIFGIVAGAAGYWLTFRRRMKRRVLKYLCERMQSDGPFSFVVELRDDCIWTRQGGTQMSFDWVNVANVVDAIDGVEFYMHNGGFVIVLNKGFLTAESRNDFMKTANQHLNDKAHKIKDMPQI
jgi:hypothetical protein